MNEKETLLSKQLKAIELAINSLDDISKSIIHMKYFERCEMNMIASRVFMSRRAVYYRLEKALKDISLAVKNLI